MKKFLHKVKYFFYLRLQNRFEKLPWKILNLNLTTSTGIKVQLKNRSDWHIYNEIFVRKDYDFAISLALNKLNAESTIRFIDLGANVGLFTLHLVDIIMQNHSDNLKFEGAAVEGSLPVYNQLQKRLLHQPFSKKSIDLIYGLAGKRTGFAKIYESGNSMTNSVTSTSKIRQQLTGRKVSYIDISNIFHTQSVIDLLKCDIEGSEEEFLETYADLMHKINVCVFELHHKKCNTDRCIALLKKYGMHNRKIILNYGDTSLEVFWKD